MTKQTIGILLIFLILFVPLFPLAYYSNKMEEHLKPQYRQKLFERRIIYYTKDMFLDEEGLKYRKKSAIAGTIYSVFILAVILLTTI